LDAETEIRMWERIDALRRSAGITCLVVSTKPFALQYADQVIALRNGRIDPASSRLLA
jgi:ABC-type cobalamin/Fe3+-siderophores transport system ATPase subunit